MQLLLVLIDAAAFAIFIPILILSAEVLAALFSKDGKPENEGVRPRLGVVIPAHDEASGIGDTLRFLIPQLQDGDRLLVVADNCTDDTAAVATAAGAEVIVRNEQSRRGKGYALDFGIRHLEGDPPAVVLIVDADCRVEAGSIDRLARVCARPGRPVQALYMLLAPPGARMGMRVAEFASRSKTACARVGCAA